MGSKLYTRSYVQEYRRPNTGRQRDRIIMILSMIVMLGLGAIWAFDMSGLYIRELDVPEEPQSVSNVIPSSGIHVYKYDTHETGNGTAEDADSKQYDQSGAAGSNDTLGLSLDSYVVRHGRHQMVAQAVSQILKEVRALRSKRVLVENLKLSNIKATLVKGADQDQVHFLLSNFKGRQYGLEDESEFVSASRKQVEMLGHLLIEINNSIRSNDLAVGPNNIMAGTKPYSIVTKDDRLIDLIITSIEPSPDQPKSVDEMFKQPFFKAGALKPPKERAWRRTPGLKIRDIRPWRIWWMSYPPGRI